MLNSIEHSTISGGNGAQGVPLYLRMAMSLRTRIYQGEWKVGDLLPPFEAMASHYGVAMNTVRKAVEMLADESLVSASRGVGTRVIANVAAAGHPQVRAAISDPLELLPDISIQVLESARQTSLCPDLIEPYPMARSYHRTLKTHSIQGMPFALLDIYVDTELYRKFPRGSEHKLKLSRLLRDYGGVKIVNSREELTISHADQRMAQLLHYPIAAPTVRLRRWRMAEGGKVVYACVATYRSDQFVWDITRSSSGQDHFGQHIIPSVPAARRPRTTK